MGNKGAITLRLSFSSHKYQHRHQSLKKLHQVIEEEKESDARY